MGNTRTSNKDILEAIEAQTAAISGLVKALTPATPVTQEPAPVTETPTTSRISEAEHQVPATYMARMDQKVSDLVAKDGQERVMYLRRNLAGEVKIAYCLKARWTSLKDNGLIGAVKVYS